MYLLYLSFVLRTVWNIYNKVLEKICQTGSKSNKRTWCILTREKNISNHAFLVLYNLWYIYSYIGLYVPCFLVLMKHYISCYKYNKEKRKCRIESIRYNIWKGVRSLSPLSTSPSSHHNYYRTNTKNLVGLLLLDVDFEIERE